MSITSVVQLDDYRTRREERLRRTVALHAADDERGAVVEHLADALTLLGADRAAMVWIDEYGPGMAHVYALLDLVPDGPRRSFDVGALHAAWEAGIPGVVDQPDLGAGEPVVSGNPVRSRAVVSLGSDGSRAWFVVVDSLSPRSPLSREASEFLMFFAGECSAVVLHLDLPVLIDDPRAETEQLRRDRFAGWPVLRDIEGREDDRAANHRISCRFMVARVVRRLIDDDFAVDEEALRGQIEGVRSELERAGEAEAQEAVPVDDPERRAWVKVLDAAGTRDLVGLASAVVEAGNRADDRAHLYGAAELHRCAYDVAVAAEAAAQAVDALRFMARAFRKLGSFDEADAWYEVAEGLAVREGEDLRRVWIYAGRTNIARERGNLPAAREMLARQFEVAGECDQPLAMAITHQGAMALEMVAGNPDRAVVHGWEAFGFHPDPEDQHRVLSNLAWTFMELGSLASAEDGFLVLTHQRVSLPVRAMAFEGLALVAARRGEAAAFEEHAAEADAERDALYPVHRCQCAVHRSDAYRALGDRDRAGEWLERARTMAEAGGFHQIAIEAEEQMARLDHAEEGRAEEGLAEETEPRDGGAGHAVAGVVQGLRGLRERVLVRA